MWKKGNKFRGNKYSNIFRTEPEFILHTTMSTYAARTYALLMEERSGRSIIKPFSECITNLERYTNIEDRLKRAVYRQESFILLDALLNPVVTDYIKSQGFHVRVHQGFTFLSFTPEQPLDLDQELPPIENLSL